MLSEASGVGRSTVTMLEHDIRNPRLPMVEHLARTLMLSPAYLAFGLEDPYVPCDDLRCAGLAQRLNDARVRLGITIRELGRRANVTEGTIRAIGRGGQPELDTLELLAGALGVAPGWLAYGLGERELPRKARSESKRPAPFHGPASRSK